MSSTPNTRAAGRPPRPRSADNPSIAQTASPDRPPRGPSGEPRRWLARVSDWIAPPENPSGVVYGLILIGALLAAESGHHETYLDTLASAVIATALYWLAYAYANVLGLRLATRQQLSARALMRALAREWPIVRGAALPLLALGLAWAAGAPLQTAVTAALWSTVASLIALELLAGIRSRAKSSELALQVAVGATIGLGILVLKIVLR